MARHIFLQQMYDSEHDETHTRVIIATDLSQAESIASAFSIQHPDTEWLDLGEVVDCGDPSKGQWVTSVASSGPIPHYIR